MKKDFPEKMKKRLLEQRKEILGRLNNQSDEMKSLVGTDESGDDADIASVAVERALLDSLNEQDFFSLFKRMEQRSTLHQAVFPLPFQG